MSLAEAIERVQQADQALAEAGPAPFALPVSGLEAVVVGALQALERGDWWVPGLRERVGAVLRDVPVERLVDGFDGARPYRVAPPTPSPALRALHAVGLGLAEPDRAALVHLGIGSAADGAFTEALNLAALLQSDVIFVVAVHPLGKDAPVGQQTAASPVGLAKAYDIPATEVDGSDAGAVRQAVSQARQAGGPALIEARLVPGVDLVAHNRSDD